MGALALAFGLTLFAGLATGIGSAIAFFAKRTNYRFLSVATGFSAGVMLYVSFVEIFYKGVDALVEAYGDHWGHWVNAASFFGGIALIAVIDNLIPSAENPHEAPTQEQSASLHSPAGTVPAAGAAGTRDKRNFHLRALAAIAQTVQAKDFERRWLSARNEQALRDIMLLSSRDRNDMADGA